MAEPSETRLYQLVALVARTRAHSDPQEVSDAVMPIFVFGKEDREAGRRAISELRRRGLTWIEYAPQAVTVPVEDWAAHVEAHWAEVAHLLPSQAEVEAMDRENGIFFGPAVGFEPLDGGAGGGAAGGAGS